MRQFFIEWARRSDLDEDAFIAMKHIMRSLLLDEEELTIYKAHSRFRISPVLLFKAIHTLIDFELIKVENMNISLLPMNDRKMSIVNLIFRTKKPSKLSSPINWLTNSDL